jgi:hypothetical protein
MAVRFNVARFKLAGERVTSAVSRSASPRPYGTLRCLSGAAVCRTGAMLGDVQYHGCAWIQGAPRRGACRSPPRPSRLLARAAGAELKAKRGDLTSANEPSLRNELLKMTRRRDDITLRYADLHIPSVQIPIT